jgi:phospholipid/cholesterol/gamma-HCH transport system ATP-binding protein
MSDDGSPVRLKAVSKSFGDLTVLDGVDLEVPRGQNFVIMGHSGTGKSVTLKIMCGLLAPDRGEVEMDGIRIDGAGPADLRQAREQMGFVFQGAALIAWLSARENVALPLRERGFSDADVRRIVDERLEDVGLSDIGDKFPSEISGGMRKRVGFARATVLEPTLVLYDEPTTGLDPVTTRTIDDLIIGARDRLGATGIVVSHDVSSALRVGDRIGLLHQGRLEVVLTPDEFVQSDHPVVRSFLDTEPADAGRRSP